MHFYRPQRSWGKVMFLQVSVILFTGGLSASVHAGIHPPPPQEQTPPRADTPLEQTPPSRHPPLEQTPLGTDPPGADPLGNRHPLGADTPPQEQTPPGNRHPPNRACWEIRSTRGRYASYWNAILLNVYLVNLDPSRRFSVIKYCYLNFLT